MSGWKGAMARPVPAWLLLLLLPAAIACAMAAEWIVNGCAGTSAEENPIRVNEVMTSNHSAVRTSYGETADYIEVVNASGEPVSLEGCMVALGEKDKSYIFPSGVLGPGEVALLFCDDGPGESAEGEYRANFSLPAAGCAVVIRPSGQYGEETVDVPALERDTVWMRNEDGTMERSCQRGTVFPSYVFSGRRFPRGFLRSGSRAFCS